MFGKVGRKTWHGMDGGKDSVGGKGHKSMDDRMKIIRHGILYMLALEVARNLWKSIKDIKPADDI
jgi:hypothetical protein